MDISLLCRRMPFHSAVIKLFRLFPPFRGQAIPEIHLVLENAVIELASSP